MKKLLVLGLSACLLFSFTGSAFASSQSKPHVKKKVVHADVSSKKPITHAKKHAATAGKKTNKTVHKKTAGHPKKA